MLNSLILIGSVVAAALTIGGVAVAIIKWVLNQNKQSDDIEALKKKHETDMAETKKKEQEDIQTIKDELCVLSYAMLASLDGLMQLHCNGNVTKAHGMLEKHLNQAAHGQNHTN
jgi:predicted negative regulator of RcsB-dependent stress response